MKKLLACVGLVLGLVGSAPAQTNQTVPLVSGYNVASTSYIYCVTADAAGRVWSGGEVGPGKLTTSGSSTTVTGVDSSADVFLSIAVGDELLINLDGVMERRYVTARASADSITVNAAINLGDGRQGTAGYGFSWRRLTCSTDATHGWIPVRGLSEVTFIFALETINATSIEAIIYCRHNSSNSVGVEAWSESYTAAGGDIVTLRGSPKDGIKFDACRFGVKVTGDGGNQSLTVTVGG